MIGPKGAASLLTILLMRGAVCEHLGAAQVPTASPFATALYRALEYRLVGPFRGGRVVAVAGVSGERHVFYMGSTGGGVWKTTDGGVKWFNISDGFFTSSSIGAIAVAASDPNIIYVGTGEACIRNNVSPGDGVYKSTDAGKTWTHVGLLNAGQISRIRVHPLDANQVYVAVLGHAFGPSPDRGVFRSVDGGATWRKVLYVSDRAGAADLAIDVANPRILYAAVWQSVRKPWTIISGGPDSGLYKSTDGGESWTALRAGLPQGIKGRIGVAVSPANSSRVWAIVEAEDGGLFRSDDGGQRFVDVNKERRLLRRPFYFMHVHADPVDENTVYVLSFSLLKSNDGGRTFSVVSTPHTDYHDLWIDPKDPAVLIRGNDGGASVSYDRGASWSPLDNQPTAEIYRVTTDDRFMYRLYGAQQDNSTISIPSRTTTSGISSRDWYQVGGGEQGQIAVDPRNPDITYAGNVQGLIFRYDRGTDQSRNILTYPQLGEGVAAKDLKYRFAALAPIRISPHDPGVLYHASQFVHRSTTDGQSWTVISPDLTRNDPSKQSESGGPITNDNTGTEIYCAIVALEESSLTPGLLWAGSDDGLVHVSRDGGRYWQNVTPKQMPEWGTVGTVEPSKHDPARAFLAVHRYREDDFFPYIFKTDDYGRTWVSLTDGSNGIPPRHFVRVVREDPVRKGLLYAGSEFGIYLSFNDGKTWQSLQLNLPVTPISDLCIRNNDLVVATQGRAFWILDDLTSLQQLSEQVASSPAHLFQPRDVYRVGVGRANVPGQGTNPHNGVVVFYTLKEPLPHRVTIEFLDGQGRLIRQFSSEEGGQRTDVTRQTGLNRFVWDLRLLDATVLAGAPIVGGTRGPKVVPGLYKVKIQDETWSDERAFEVKKDPRLSTTTADFQAQMELALRIRDAITRTYDAVDVIRALRQEMANRAKRVMAPNDLVLVANRLTAKASSIETELIQTRLETGLDLHVFGPKLVENLVELYNVVIGADARPTDGAYQRNEDLTRSLDTLSKRLDTLLTSDLELFNRVARQNGLPAVVVRPRSF